jgi:glycosyltransferase involved in cell wall biosynthesis
MKKPRIFQGLVNYGTQSGLFAKQLRENGFEALSVTHYDRFNRITDFELLYGGNFFQKLLRNTFNYLFRIFCIIKYDIFHFYYGTTLLPRQCDLPLYRLLGKKVVMEYLGSDIQSYQKSVEKYKWTNINYLMTEEEGLRFDEVNLRRFSNEVKYVDKFLVGIPTLSEFVSNSDLLPLAIDLNIFNFVELPEFDGTFKIMHAPTHRGNKGTDFIVGTIDRLKFEGYSIELDLVENVTHNDLITRYRNCHLFIDQILSGWYGTASIEAMAIGRPVIVTLRPEYFQFIDFGDQLPIYHADPDIIYTVLKELLDQGYDELKQIGLKSRKFVEEVHDVEKVTEKLIKIYENL